MNWAIYRFPKLLTWNWSASTGCFLTALSQKSVFSRSALGKQVDFVTTREQTPRTSRYPGLPGSRGISRQLLQTDCQVGPPRPSRSGRPRCPSPVPLAMGVQGSRREPGFRTRPREAPRRHLAPCDTRSQQPRSAPQEPGSWEPRFGEGDPERSRAAAAEL